MSKTKGNGLTGSEKMNAAAIRPDFDAIKKTTDIVRVIGSYITLKRQGADFVGLCPFHDDHNPSLRVTPGKNLFRCPSCGAAGNVIQFVAKKEGITDKQAALKLLTQIPGVQRAEAVPSAPKAAATPPASVNTAALLKRVVAFYAKTLLSDRAGFDYLKSRNLVDATMLEVFQVGYCNGTLHKALPKSGEIIEGLKALGVLDKSGREILRGRITIPIHDAQGNVSGLYARNIHPCEKGDRHRYLAGPHRGVWNGACAKTSQTLFITEAILDAMALWQAGFRNAIALYGTEGFTADHETLLRENGATEIYLALDNDETGREAVTQLKEKLSSLVKSVHVITWPEGVHDAADFFLSRSASDFETLVKAANPPKEDQPDTTPKSEVTAKLGEETITMTPGGFNAGYGARRYEMVAIERPSAARLKATVKALSTEAGRFHIDTVDFYLSRSRRVFIAEAARLFRDVPDVIEADVNRLTLQLESYVEKRLAEKSPTVALVSEGDRLEATRMGRSPDLVAEIVGDMERLGAVGEETNKLAGYLIMTSRKMDDPLALLTLSSSGAGKSHLQDTILSLCPDEDLIKVTSLSDRALFYKGEDSLRHKVLAVEEEAGASGAHYAIRNLISSKKLVIETTIKNPLTGKMETQVNTVRGPTSVFQTTTNPETDAETRSRFIITSVDESSEQTRAILAAQRQGHTLEGLLRKAERKKIVARHHAFQRMLKPIAVLNPFEPLLRYGEDRLVFRRENPKYLSLILAVAFLRQMQREVKHHPDIGDFIEVTLEDIAVANDVATALFGLSLDDLSSPSRDLLRLITKHASEKAERLGVKMEKVEFSRRELREALGWSEYRLRSHLRELVAMEYMAPTCGRHGALYCYRLLYDGSAETRFVPGLKSVKDLRREAGTMRLTSLAKSELRCSKTNFVGASLVPTNEVEKGHFPSENGNGNGHFVENGGRHIPVFAKNGSHKR